MEKYKVKKLYFLIYFFGAIISTQLIPYLKTKNYDEQQSGIILASIAIFCVLFHIFFGLLSDKNGKIKKYFIIIIVVCVLLSSYFYLTNNNFILTFLIVGMIGGLCRCFQSLVDTWIFQVKDYKKNFNIYKCSGSIGWGIGCFAVAIILRLFNFKIISFISVFIGLLILYNTKNIKDIESNKHSIKLKYIGKLLQNKEYILINLIMLLLFTMGCADIYLVVNKLISIGGTQLHIGLKWGFQSLVEAPMFFMMSKLVDKYGHIKLLLFSTIMFGLRFLLYSLINSPNLLVLSGIMQMITFPIALYCTKHMIDEITPKKYKSTSLMFSSSFYMGLSLLIMPILTSQLTKIYSYDITLRIVASFSIIALLLILYLKKIKT